MEIRQLASGNWALIAVKTINGRPLIWALFESRPDAEQALALFHEGARDIWKMNATNKQATL